MSPYKLETPAVVSFSGGRTSGYMLYHILQAFGGKLPDDVKVVFCNTGKERPETLDFVERCSQEWGVDVTWLEYTSELKTRPLVKSRNGRMESAYEHGFKIVNYATASRNGEPLEAVIRARNMLPNVMARFCTVECKIRTTQRYLKSLNWHKDNDVAWTNAIGFRADEPQRVAKLAVTNRHSNEAPEAPLYKAGVTKADIVAWWDKQPFQLQLKDHEGNCDLCFLKGAAKIQAILRERPDLADWWMRMEAEAEAEAVRKGTMRIPSTAFFRKDRPRYSVQLEMAQRPGLFDNDPNEADELSIACHCTD